MHKNVTKCNETLSKWCKNKHGASKIMDTLETYQRTWAGPEDEGLLHRGASMVEGGEKRERGDGRLGLEGAGGG
jgi:hypothetical protein